MRNQNTKLRYGPIRGDGSRLVYNGLQCIGRLMPRIDTATLAASAGIQPHSKPGSVPNVTQYDADSVVNFAAHWEKTNRETYPLTDNGTRAPLRTTESDARKARLTDFYGEDS